MLTPEGTSCRGILQGGRLEVDGFMGSKHLLRAHPAFLSTSRAPVRCESVWLWPFLLPLQHSTHKLDWNLCNSGLFDLDVRLLQKGMALSISQNGRRASWNELTASGFSTSRHLTLKSELGIIIICLGGSCSGFSI